MNIQAINNGMTFEARLDLVADKRCLPKGATKRLHKLAQTIGTKADTITIGVFTRGTDKTVVRENLLGCRYKDRVAGSIDTYIATTATCPDKELFIPFVEKTITGTKYPNAISKYFNSKEIKMNNYKTVYKYMLDLRDKFNPTV